MYDCLADEVRRVMMETVIPTITNLVKALKSKTTKEDSQVQYITYSRLYLYTSILNVMGKMRQPTYAVSLHTTHVWSLLSAILQKDLA